MSDKNKTGIENFNLKAIETNANLTIKEIIGIYADIVVGVEENDKCNVISLESNNVYGGISPRMFKSVQLVPWSSNINADNELFIKINYRYTHFDGGSNGFSVADLLFDLDGNVIKIVNHLWWD